MSITQTLRVMKLTALFLTVLSLHVMARTEAQTISYKGKNVSLKTVFAEIKKQTHFYVVYNAADVETSRQVNVQAKDEPLVKFLNRFLGEQGLKFRMEDNTIVISPKEKNSASLTQDLNPGLTTPPPPIDVHGVVKDEAGKPIIGASVYVKGTNKGTTTNNDGEFTLTGIDDNITLVISAVNIETSEVGVNGRKEINLVAKVKVSQFMDVEITAVNTGYQIIPKERSTGSFEKISSNLFNQQTTTSILDRLESIANGVFFDRKTAGAGTKNITIRGLSTIQGPKSPLIVIDNFPYEGDINNINPNDVDNITILKDASAASIWGTKAGNGVIVITTKKGQFNQKILTEFNANVSILDRPNVFYFNNISSTDFIDVEKYLYGRGYYNSQVASSSRTVLSPVIEFLLKKKSGALTSAEADAKINALRSQDVRNDFNKYLYQNALNQQYALNIRGGSNNASWLLSAGYDNNVNQQSALYKRVNLRSSNSFKILSKIQLTADVYFTQTKSKAGKPGYSEVATTNGKIPPYLQLADEAGNPLPVIKTYRQPYLDTAGGGKLLDWNYYPLVDQDFIDNMSNTQDLLANIGLNYRYNQNLSFDIKYQHEQQTSIGKILYDQQSYFARDMINSYSQLNRVSGIVTYKVPKGGIIDNSTRLQRSNAIRGQLNYIVKKENSQLSIIAGSEIRQVKSNANSFRNYGYNSDILTYGTVDFTTAYPNFISGNTSFINDGISYTDINNRFVSFYANAAYYYSGKYTLSVSGRRDASNLFGVATNDKWTPLWSVGYSWDISKESFYHFDPIPTLKFRVSYGLSGNADPSRSALTTIIYGNNSVYTQSPVARIGQYYNPGLRWERVSMFNTGIDFATKTNRISGSLEYYTKNGTDLFGNSPADYTGVSTNFLVKNAASIKAEGLDISLNTINIKGKFSWTSSLNLNLYKDKVVKYFLPSKQGSNYVNGGTSISAIEGRPVYAVYAYHWAGLDPATGDPMGIYKNAIVKDYTQLTGSSTLISDLVYNGPAFPTLFGSLGNTFSWNNLSLTIRLSYKAGYYFQRSSINYSLLFANRQGHGDYALRWQKPGDEQLTSVPSMVYPAVSSRDNFYNNSEVLVEKGDHIRLQYVTLGYDVDKQKCRWLPVSSIQIYANANNLGILWRANKYGLDPDYLNTSIPSSPSITLGIRTTL